MRSHARAQRRQYRGSVGPDLATRIRTLERACRETRTVAQLRRELKDERQLTAKLTDVAETLRDRVQRRERQLDTVTVCT